ncbi:uncharacterized protein LOC106171012 [Lingula anatina]|uniref:Uncharacterized protein LOC106171012 n=1 Tax=Lingula anatina TaxID=7574 RepID=A0A1S3J830_LINAN|nr:uncharacterized protein LOC106171012 [Lingula anatina]|eukprot:XP_013406555.2 uncharacterized protein LOC106171012 [Lingula anatina]
MAPAIHKPANADEEVESSFPIPADSDENMSWLPRISPSPSSTGCPTSTPTSSRCPTPNEAIVPVIRKRKVVDTSDTVVEIHTLHKEVLQAEKEKLGLEQKKLKLEIDKLSLEIEVLKQKKQDQWKQQQQQIAQFGDSNKGNSCSNMYSTTSNTYRQM